MAEEESMLFCLSYDGLWRVVIPDYGKLRREYPPLRMEKVFSFDPHLLPRNMGIFSSAQKVYLVGGKDYHPIFPFQFKFSYNMFVVDPTSFEGEEFPVINPQFLYEPIILPPCKMKPLVSPMVIQVDHRLYLLTEYNLPWIVPSLQSFDPTDIENPFQFLVPPPCTHNGIMFKVVSHFAALDYIYLFIQGGINEDKQLSFRFNTKSPRWKESKSMVDQFKNKQIPLPSIRSGDTGVSQELPNHTRILVAITVNTPTAYCVTLGHHGFLKPISSRFLSEIGSSSSTGRAHLHDIGSKRFCTTLQNLDIGAFEVFVFRIDFEEEYRIQSAEASSHRTSLKERYAKAPRRTSLEILSSRKILDHFHSFYAYCLASACASQSSTNLIDAAEEQEQERDGEMDKGTREGKGRGECTVKGQVI